MTPIEFMKKYPQTACLTAVIDSAGGVSLNPCELVHGGLKTLHVSSEEMTADLAHTTQFMAEVLGSQPVEIDQYGIDAKVKAARQSDEAELAEWQYDHQGELDKQIPHDEIVEAEISEDLEIRSTSTSDD